jgi:hypothetical protein
MPGTSGRSGGSRSMGGDPTPADGLPSMPDGLSESAALKWTQLMEEIPSENLRKVDGHLLSQLAVLLAEADSLARRIASDPFDDKARRMHLQTLDRVSRFSVQFGLTPADRRRGKMETPQADPTAAAFSEWLGKRGKS